VLPSIGRGRWERGAWGSTREATTVAFGTAQATLAVLRRLQCTLDNRIMVLRSGAMPTGQMRVVTVSVAATGWGAGGLPLHPAAEWRLFNCLINARLLQDC
jgi:hypothetical protein